MSPVTVGNSLSPGFVKVETQSLYAPHTITIPTVALAADPGFEDGWKYVLRGAELPVSVADAMNDLIPLLLPFYQTTTQFISWTAYNQPTPSDHPTPVVSHAIGAAGTDGSTTWAKAVQFTYTWRATDFGLFKFEMLDVASGNNFDREVAFGGSGRLHDLDAYITADASFLAARTGGRPEVFLQVSKTLNEKLRRAYRMT